MEELYLNKYHCKSAKLKFLNKIQKNFCENKFLELKVNTLELNFNFFIKYTLSFKFNKALIIPSLWRSQ